MILTTLKLFSLFMAIWFTSVNISRLMRGEDISWKNFVIQSFSITIFIGLQFNLFN